MSVQISRSRAGRHSLSLGHFAKARQIRRTTSIDGVLERLSHQRDIASRGNGRVRHHRIRTHLHRIAGLARTSDTSVDDDRHMRVGDDDFDEVTHAQAHIGADQRTERHNGSGTGLLQLTGRNRVREHVGHDHEAFLGQHFGGSDGGTWSRVRFRP